MSVYDDKDEYFKNKLIELKENGEVLLSNNTNTLMLPTSNYPINKPEIEIVETSTYIPPEIPIFVVPKDEKIEKEVEEAYQRCKTSDEFFEWLKNN